MMKFDAILLLGGSSKRINLGFNKVLYKINDKPVFYYSLVKFLSFDNLNKIVIVTKNDEIELVKDFINKTFDDDRIIYTIGGLSRGESVYNGAKCLKEENILIHDGARPIISIDDIINCLKALENHNVVSLSQKINESVRLISENKPIDRNNLVLMKTPQGAKRELIIASSIKAQNEGIEFSDDVSLIEYFYHEHPFLIDASPNNIKITEQSDLDVVSNILGTSSNYLIGESTDIHRLESGEYITLGGVKINCEFRVVAHSDGDCLYHAISEAIIGALGKGDLGSHFPDTDLKYKDCDSKIFLEEALKMANECGYKINNIDSTILIEKPMMRPYILDMVKNISNILKTSDFRVNVKATRGEKVGDIGESRAVVCKATVMLVKE